MLVDVPVDVDDEPVEVDVGWVQASQQPPSGTPELQADDAARLSSLLAGGSPAMLTTILSAPCVADLGAADALGVDTLGDDVAGLGTWAAT